MNVKNVRTYSGSDGYMLETSGALHLLFNEDLAAFTAFDSTMDAAFSTAWKAAITAAHDVIPDSLIKDIQAGKTLEVLELMEKAKEKYNEVKFFSHKVFKNNLPKRNEFGVDSYERARKSQTGMITLLGEMSKTCQKYSEELLAGGFDQAKMDEIETLRIALDEANLEQESYKRGRPTLTLERIQVLNACYDFTRTVMDAAVVVFYNNQVRRRAYVFDPTGSGSTKKDKEILSIVVQSDNNAVLAYSIPFLDTRQISINNNGPADVEVYLSNDINAMSNMQMVPAGIQQIFTSNELGIDGDNLYLRAMGPGSEATVEVEIRLE